MSEQTEQKLIRELETDGSGVLLPFETKKGRYNVIRPGDPLGIVRWTEYERLALVMGTGQTFAQLLDALDNIKNLLGSNKTVEQIRVEAILLIASIQKGIIDMSKARFSKAMYQASIFICREGDDRMMWDMATAEDYIQDWAEEGLSEHSFFAFAALTVNGLIPTFRKLEAERRQLEEKLLGITG